MAKRPYIPVQSQPSTCVKAMGYVPKTGTLRIQFPGGRQYDYLGVGRQVARNLENANSMGGHFNRRIKDRYPFRRV